MRDPEVVTRGTLAQLAAMLDGLPQARRDELLRDLAAKATAERVKAAPAHPQPATNIVGRVVVQG